MGKHTTVPAWAAGLCLAACSGNASEGTGGAGGGGSATLTGDLAVVSHIPAADAVQVDVGAVVVVRFDGVVTRDCLNPDDLWLEATASGERVAGSLAQSNGGKDVTFRPAAPLAKETDYTFHASPFVCDSSGRILADEHIFTFRTFDDRPPALIRASVQEAARDVDRLGSFQLTFDEPLDPESLAPEAVYLRDVYGGSYPVRLSLRTPSEIEVDPLVDLPGDRRFVLAVAGGGRGPTDRAGNPVAAAWTVTFRTAVDTTPPTLLSIWPRTGTIVSPHLQPVLTFDESIDPGSVELASVSLVDSYANAVVFRVVPSDDRRRLWLVPDKPLDVGVTYTLRVRGGISGVTDLSGNPLLTGGSVEYVAGDDAAAPRLTAALPAAATTGVSLNVRPSLTFDEPLDSAWAGSEQWVLLADGAAVPCSIAIDPGRGRVQLTPLTYLRPATRYTVAVRGDRGGVRDRAGNCLASDLRLEFTTAGDRTLPQVIMLPADGNVTVSPRSRVTVLLDAPLDPASVDAGSLTVRHRSGAPFAGTVTLERGGRAVVFSPTDDWTPGGWYVATLRGGPDGVREPSGNWLGDDEVHEFRIGYQADATRPNVRVTLNATDDSRKTGMQVPGAGFTIDVFADDPVDYAVDPTTFAIDIVGTGAVPSSEELFAAASVTRRSASYVVGRDRPFAAGEYTVTARVRDLSGNLAESTPLTFSVVTARSDQLPFERTHVVWARTDLDRNGNGTPDFEDDLLALGFIAAGDPLGLNERMTRLLRDGILARVNALYGRSPIGARRDENSVAIRFTSRRPAGVAHMQIALGGNDPEGPAGRTYGAESTGVLGRAYFDHHNSRINDLNIATRPGLGVFPGEMYLFQAQVHRRVYPAFVTTFARRFLNLSPPMGGDAVGTLPVDAVVVAPGFDYANGTAEQRARFDAIFLAADEWAAAIGVILAHEVGHAVGLVAEGANPLGLHGDASLHNEFSSTTDVMASAVGYDSLVLLDYRFRDLNLAYLRQHMVLR